MTPAPTVPWLLFFHQLGPQPGSLRVKVWRRLAAIGAVSLKNAVYALPNTDGAREDLQWLLQEIEKEGGEGSICQAQFIDGIADPEVVALFQEARGTDYGDFVTDAQKLAPLATTPVPMDQLARLRRRLGEIIAIDFFHSPAREEAEGCLDELESRTRAALDPGTGAGLMRSAYQGRTWATRAGIYIDRIASAWLIRMSIDPRASFRFLVHGEKLRPTDIGFDLAGGEFTHVGDQCTFETLLQRFSLDEPALAHLAGIIHDLDIKDGRHAHPETDGVALAVKGIALSHAADEDRLGAGCALFDHLLIALRHGRPRARRTSPVNA